MNFYSDNFAHDIFGTWGYRSYSILKKYKMIRARKHLVILSLFFTKAHSINLILLGTHLEPLIIIIKLNTSFAETASAPSTFPSPRHFQTLSSVSANRTYAFLFSDPDTPHATPQVCEISMGLMRGIAQTYECIVHLLPRVRSFNVCVNIRDVYLSCT